MVQPDTTPQSDPALEPVRLAVRTLLAAKRYGNPFPSDMADDQSLLNRGVVDSFGLFAFIRDLEKRFEIQVQSREIHPGNFETIDRIARFVLSKTTASPVDR